MAVERLDRSINSSTLTANVLYLFHCVLATTFIFGLGSKYPKLLPNKADQTLQGSLPSVIFTMHVIITI